MAEVEPPFREQRSGSASTRPFAEGGEPELRPGGAGIPIPATSKTDSPAARVSVLKLVHEESGDPSTATLGIDDELRDAYFVTRNPVGHVSHDCVGLVSRYQDVPLSGVLVPGRLGQQPDLAALLVAKRLDGFQQFRSRLRETKRHGHDHSWNLPSICLGFIPSSVLVDALRAQPSLLRVPRVTI